MNQYLDAAIKAARAAGALVRENFGRPLKVNVKEAHDIKLDVDVRSQALITDYQGNRSGMASRLSELAVRALIEEAGDTETSAGGPRQVPYAYFLLGLTTLVVATDGVTDPAHAYRRLPRQQAHAGNFAQAWALK